MLCGDRTAPETENPAKQDSFLKTYIHSDGIIKIPLLFDIIHTNVRY